MGPPLMTWDQDEQHEVVPADDHQRRCNPKAEGNESGNTVIPLATGVVPRRENHRDNSIQVGTRSDNLFRFVIWFSVHAGSVTCPGI